MVEVEIKQLNVCLKNKNYILKDESNQEVGYQVIYNEAKKPERIIFQANVKAGASTTYTLGKGKPTSLQPKTWARFVPERKDDFAWENDIAAYRMYGPALANENPSNGVDLWLKRTNELIVDKFYHDELKNKLSYHVDHGQGLDCYKVGHTLGAGGIAPYFQNKLWVGNHYNSYKIIETGPLRSTFMLTYDTVKIGNDVYKQTITISTNAGSIMNKAVVRYEGLNQPMKLAAGIFLHDGKGSLKNDAANGYIAYAEDAVSDAKVPSGRNYVGIVMPQDNTESVKETEHILLMSDYKIGEEFIYYFGGGWSKWGFPTDADWFKAVSNFTKTIKQPLKVNIK
jgi:hypothetical protein